MNYLADLTLLTALYWSLALALQLPYVWGGRLILCQGTIVGLGAYAMSATQHHWAWSLPASFGLVVLAGVTAGWLMALLLRRLSDAAFALSTYLLALAGAEGFENLDYITGGYTGVPGPEVSLVQFAGLSAKGNVAILLLGVGVLFSLFSQFLRLSEPGRAIRAIRDDYLGAHLDGIEVWKLERGAYALFGGQTALIGALWSFALPQVVPKYFDVMSFGLLIVLVCIIGTSEHPLGPALGAAFVVALHESVERLTLPPELKGEVPLLVVGVIYVLFVLVPPRDAYARIRSLAASFFGRRAHGSGSRAH